MKLGVISDAHHFYDARGRLCTLGPVARQFEQWAGLFESVTVCAPLAAGLAPPTTSPYAVRNLELLPVGVAGGNSIVAKVRLALQLVPWWRAIQELLARVDAVHIRCPNNISILGLLALERSDRLRQAVYTGTWLGYPTEPRWYRWQREYLRDRFEGPVAVYGEWPGQPAHVIPSFSPSYREADWHFETANVAARVATLRSSASLPCPLRLVSVGGLDRNKNQQVAIRAVKTLASMNVEAQLHILGDGPERPALAALINELELQDRVFLDGLASQVEVRRHYRSADFVIQPTRAEGFGKVPLEAFFHGVVPLMSDINLHPQFAGRADDARGRCFPTEDHVAVAGHVAALAQSPAEMARMIENGRRYAIQFTMEAWLRHIKAMLTEHWRLA